MGWRVLVVDDEERYCALLRRALERDGFRVTTAVSGEDAAELLLREGTDLLVTDLDMPGLTGFDLLELAGRLPAAPALLVITAQKALLEGTAARLRNAHCLLKPFTLEDLRAKAGLLTGGWRPSPVPS